MEFKELRQKYGLTQKGMAEITGVPERTIRSWEIGERRPPAYVLPLLEALLREKAAKK